MSNENLKYSVSELLMIGKIERANAIFRNSVVSFDIDGVDVNSAEASIGVVNARYGTQFSVNDLTSYWGLTELLEQVPQIEDPLKVAVEIWNSEFVLKNSFPEPGAWLLSNFLCQSGIIPIRVTSRPAETRQTTFSWYNRWLPWIVPAGIYIQESGGEISTEFKVETIKKLKVSFHLEDSFEQAETIVERTGATVVLVPQTWNRGYVSRDKKIITLDKPYLGLPKVMAAYFTLVDLVAQS